MKAAFNIPPSAGENNSLHLLVETGDYGVSIIWFIKDPFSVKGLAIFNKPDDEEEINLEEIFKSQEAFLSNISSTTICYDFKETLLIPDDYHDLSAAEVALNLLYGEGISMVLNNDQVTSSNIYNYYRVKKQTEAFFTRKFPANKTFHSSSLLIGHLNKSADILYCIILHNSFKVLLYKDGTLQFVQQFNYSVPEDVAYHLLNVCEQHDIKPLDVQLQISGMIEKKSALYQELYKYFMNITLGFGNNSISALKEIMDLPFHFFSHLTALALCVS